MSATQIQDAMPGEDLLGIEPELLQQVDPGWLHRLNLYPGRALTAPALLSEQLYRAGRLATLGQCVTQGTVKGLEFSADFTQTDPVLQVSPGYGISATGEDVAVLRTLRTTLGSLQVVDPQTGAVILSFPQYAQMHAGNNYAGVLLLQPVTGQVNGAAVDTGAQPLIVSGNLNASCDQDPEEYAFEDWQIVDGVRLVMVAWPASPGTLMTPSVTPAASWRNRLVYTVYNAELQLSPEDRLPWDLLGVPVGLFGADSSGTAFVDRWSVVRAGGLPRRRYVLPAQPGAAAPILVQPALAQARVNQLSEQLNALLNAPAPQPAFSNLVPAFAFLPPCGVLPAAAIDFVHRTGAWFPANWALQVGPIHQEEIETVLLAGMTGLPLDVTQDETVEVLVPLPDAAYDPEILLNETVDPAFQQAVDSATQERDGVLQHRKAIQQEANALSQVLTGAQQPPPYDPDAGLTPLEIAARDAQIYTPASTETFGTTQLPVVGAPPGADPVTYSSNDLQALLTAAGNPPYTILKDGNGNPLAAPLTLFSQDDLDDMAQNGLQHFIDRINAKVSRANDLIDLAFLTAQSDIYRFRQFILGASDATALAISPTVANIATGESAAATAANLQNYLGSFLPPPATTTTRPPAGPQAVSALGGSAARSLVSERASTRLVSSISASRPPAKIIRATSGAAAATETKAAASLTLSKSAASSVSRAAAFTPINPGTPSQPATPGDVLQQSPIVGAQLNLRTLTIAQRMANPPSQTGVFYAVGNREAFLQLLADLEITIDDITILVDQWTPPTTTTPPPTSTPPPARAIMPTMADFRLNAAVVLQAVGAPNLNLNSDEADLFSTGIHVVDQHTTLLRAVEARIAQYNDFVTQCGTALANIQSYLPQAQKLLTQLDNDLAQARQDLAFTTALLNDETQRVDGVNAQRAQTLANVQALVYTRPGTLAPDVSVPSRQLVPGNIASPVPSCLQSSIAIPPELREIVALLREAPVNWLPAIQKLLNQLERPTLLQAVAVDAQARASMQLQLPLRASSAASEPGVYAPVISSIYGANQQAFRAFQTQRAAFQPVQLVNQSWATQVQLLQNVTAAGDLLSSDSVHAEVANATSRLMQQISSVATCLYTRAGQALPIDRLAWAEFLRGTGLSIQMQSLAVLPNWNSQDYVSRQQMQMLVDWLFQQIDTGNSSAVAFMSDVVRVAILLASDAPVDNVIAGAVTLATTPKVGGVISLTLPSDRVAHGMYVQLYSSGVLAAQAVVTDLDTSGVKATVTQVYQAGVALQANDVAHFSAQAPQMPALRAFAM
ncbi:MAG TPA: hypothetical protein VMG35_24925 [Bryobacteraceae bacterium]|nr:hypothetical protein [Bryobacteraceae bacterium]